MHTLVIDGHPNPNSLCAALATRYADAHGDARILAVRDLAFDQNLRFGYTKRQELEPDLRQAWTAIQEATRIVLVTPVWWGSVPSLLQGFFDRLLLPRMAYDASGTFPKGLLKGRSARIIMTADSPGTYLRLTGNTPVRQLKTHVLGFIGLSPIAVTRFSPVKTSTAEKREQWLAEASTLGENDARRYLPAPSPALMS
ncbi:MULTISPECIES: NAD(P)H-dependent oxidoreductase [unclassified Pseudoclavibacter]|uniref:NAD(P)H-dependent oxidoreductase n=1 Tax=unclassified Pseudoclavibacter TaxID=2615177 RepID=UPI001BA89A69|nr:NAD(P)H-dependent oxidoreductase [Pseudoclavibacter sp. Marseille-Q4354]MBS3179552.1 NAD(P)H-dependent oxidoreductase [Pseudoclavibacter sp. Marseille-Q4354]